MSSYTRRFYGFRRQIVWGFVANGVFLVLLGAYFSCRGVIALRGSERTNGTITGFELVTIADQRVRRPIVEYSEAERRVSFVSEYSDTRYREGTSVPVIYRPGYPESAIIGEWWNLHGIGAVAFVSGIAAFGVASWFSSSHRRYIGDTHCGNRKRNRVRLDYSSLVGRQCVEASFFLTSAAGLCDLRSCLALPASSTPVPSTT